MVRAGVQVRAVVRVVRPLERINHSNNRKYPFPQADCGKADCGKADCGEAEWIALITVPIPLIP